jgi:hypothetical protein
MKKQGVWELFVAEVNARTGEVSVRRDGTSKRRDGTSKEEWLRKRKLYKTLTYLIRFFFVTNF